LGSGRATVRRAHPTCRPRSTGGARTSSASIDGLAGSLELDRRAVRLSFESPNTMLKFYGETAEPKLELMQSLDEESKASLRQEFLEVVGRFNQASDGSVEVDAEYLLAVARRRG
jgi:hypothetical protein